jgi:hypothetical protein
VRYIGRVLSNRWKKRSVRHASWVICSSGRSSSSTQMQVTSVFVGELSQVQEGQERVEAYFS